MSVHGINKSPPPEIPESYIMYVNGCYTSSKDSGPLRGDAAQRARCGWRTGTAPPVEPSYIICSRCETLSAAVAACRTKRYVIDRAPSGCAEGPSFKRKRCNSTRCPRLPSDAATRNDVTARAPVAHALSTGDHSSDPSAFHTAHAGHGRSVSLIGRSLR